MNRREKRQKEREESERKRKEELAAKKAQAKDESSEEESSEEESSAEEDSPKEDGEEGEESALVFGLPLPQWQVELRLLVAEELSVVDVAELTVIEVRTLCHLTYGRAKKFCAELKQCIESEAAHYDLVTKAQEEEEKAEKRRMGQAEELAGVRELMEKLQQQLESKPLPTSGMRTPDLTPSPGLAERKETSAKWSLNASSQGDRIDLCTPAPSSGTPPLNQAEADFGSSKGPTGATRRLELEQPGKEPVSLAVLDKYCRLFLEKQSREQGKRETLLGDVYGDRDTLEKLLPPLELFEKGVPELRSLKVFESSVARLIGELALSKASKEEVAYWLFDAARSLKELYGRLGKLPFILIDYVYVTILFGKQPVPMSVREAQRGGEADPLAVPRTIYREYCNRLVLSTIFEKLSRGNSAIREWWARVQMGGLMCDKSFRDQYAKFVSRGGDFVERAAEGVEATFRVKGEEFQPTLMTIEVICNQVQNDIVRYRKKAARVNELTGYEGLEVALQEEDDLLQFYLEGEIQSEMTSREVAAVKAFAPGPSGTGRLQCYNCRESGHMSFRCERPCKTHPESPSRRTCSKCEERYRARNKARFGAGFNPPHSSGASTQQKGSVGSAPVAVASGSSTNVPVTMGTGEPSASRGGSGGG